MKIEAIESTKSPQGKLRLRFDNEESMLVLPSVIADLGLYVGIEISETALKSIQQTVSEASAKERAVRIVSATPVTKRELFHRLVQKGESEENAEMAVQWLEDLRLLDDKSVAEGIVRSGAARGYGAARIRQMLYEKRVPKHLWDEALAKMPAQDDAIDAFLAKRFKGKTPDRAECKRATDALIRRGHSWSEIKLALGRHAPDEEFED